MPSLSLPSLPTTVFLFPLLLFLSLPLIPFALLTTSLALVCLAIRALFIYAELTLNLLRQQVLYGGADDPSSAPVSLALSEYSLKPVTRTPSGSSSSNGSGLTTAQHHQRARRGSRPLHSHPSSGSITPARRSSTPYLSFGSPPPASTTTGQGGFANLFGPATTTAGVYGGGNGAAGGFGFYNFGQASGSSVTAGGAGGSGSVAGSVNGSGGSIGGNGGGGSGSANTASGTATAQSSGDRDYEGMGGWRDADDEDTDTDAQWTSMNRRLELPSGLRTPGGSSSSAINNYSGPNSAVNGGSSAGGLTGAVGTGEGYAGPRSTSRPGHRRSNTGGSIHLDRGFSALSLRSLRRAHENMAASSTYSIGSNGGGTSNRPKSLYAGSTSHGNGYSGQGYASGSGSGSGTGGSGDYAFLTTNAVGQGGHQRLSGTASPEEGGSGAGGGLMMKMSRRSLADMEEMNIGKARSGGGGGGAGGIVVGPYGGSGSGAGQGHGQGQGQAERRKSGSSASSSGGQSGKTVNGGNAGMTAAGGWMAP